MLANLPDFGRTDLINGAVMLSEAKHPATSTVTDGGLPVKPTKIYHAV